MTPCGVAALAGVNESGLAVVVAPAPSTAQRPCRFAAPAALFVQECLQRFDAVGPAAAWCLDRPAAGRFELLLLDASGAVAAVRTNGEARERIEPTHAEGSAGSLTAGNAVSLAARNAELLTAGNAGSHAAGAFTLVLLDPVARTLTRLGPGEQRVRLAVEDAGKGTAPR